MKTVTTTTTTTTLDKKIKATILLENTWGMNIVRHVWLRVYGTKKSGFKSEIYAHYTYKGKRKTVGFSFEKAVIAKGWQNIETPVDISKNTEFVIFDEETFELLKAKLENIIIETN
jgi:hypothetical protein